MADDDDEIECVPLDALREDDVLYEEDVLGKLIEKESLEEVRRRTIEREPGLWRMIAYRFGVDGERPHDLESTAAEFGLTREKARQREMKFFSSYGRHHERSRLYWRLEDED